MLFRSKDGQRCSDFADFADFAGRRVRLPTPSELRPPLQGPPRGVADTSRTRKPKEAPPTRGAGLCAVSFSPTAPRRQAGSYDPALCAAATSEPLRTSPQNNGPLANLLSLYDGGLCPPPSISSASAHCRSFCVGAGASANGTGRRQAGAEADRIPVPLHPHQKLSAATTWVLPLSAVSIACPEDCVKVSWNASPGTLLSPHRCALFVLLVVPPT